MLLNFLAFQLSTAAVTVLAIIAVVLISYFVGSISFSVLFCHIFHKKDIRSQGSKNAGTTNMYRVYGIGLATLTFLGDSLKGVLCCYVAHLILTAVHADFVVVGTYIAGLIAVIGHIYSFYFKYKGGKGFATTLGVSVYLMPLLMVFVLPAILVLIILIDKMSVAALLMFVFLCAYQWIFLLDNVGVASCIMFTAIAVLGFIAHRQNISRILAGCEPSLGIRARIFGGNKQCSDE